MGDEEGEGFEAIDISNALDPQVGWEQQKFLIAWTLLYLPSNQRQEWIDMMRIWEIGVDNDPGFENRLEFHHQRARRGDDLRDRGDPRPHRSEGIAARVLEYANSLLEKAYVVEDGPDINNDGNQIGTCRCLVMMACRWSNMTHGFSPLTGAAGRTTRCTCAANLDCIALEDYVSVPFFMRQAMDAYGLPNLGPRHLLISLRCLHSRRAPGA